jgi:NAD(P)-dependent dehydrogenase (short-subunit alcohol dehydrogenase family)
MARSREMKGRRVLVTGAGTGLGREIALEFAREGADIVLHYAHSEPGARAAVESIRNDGGKAEAFYADLRHIDQIARLAGDTIEYLGGVDVLINNAGITMNLPFERVTPDQFDALYDVNVRAQFFLTQHVLPSMLDRGGGVVINLSTIHAYEGMQEYSVYAGTGGAITAFTRQLAVELAPKGIRVNAIAPGAIEVESHYRAVPDLDPMEFGRNIPAGFMGQPSDIARVAVFLASDDARFFVGQTLVVDGGTTSWMPWSDSFRRPLDFQLGRGYVPGL